MTRYVPVAALVQDALAHNSYIALMLTINVPQLTKIDTDVDACSKNRPCLQHEAKILLLQS